MRAVCALFQPGAQRGRQVRFVPNYRYFAHPILRNFVVAKVFQQTGCELDKVGKIRLFAANS